MNLEALKFPIGKFQFDPDVSNEQVQQWINTIASFPEKIEAITKPLSTEQLNWRYRPEGWSIKQVIHHLADSHMNALIRIKLALTENAPVIRPYEESLWAQLNDGLNNDIGASVKIIDGVHEKWAFLLNHLIDQDWNKMYFHPQHQRLFSVKEGLGIYDWHCNHHFAHIQQALDTQGSFGSTE
ncbi:YfiT family bacillithiol transferase [Flavobacterium sp. H122]|uniref:YfiT family bacillithiol transferase n=1 Tax=Flavobacterium sp. H122 TaxID=2529860 RepID=UPI0010AB0484|nr:putative metal-dependent hydrolase [Flavobacterium sp. H122]